MKTVWKKEYSSKKKSGNEMTLVMYCANHVRSTVLSRSQGDFLYMPWKMEGRIHVKENTSRMQVDRNAKSFPTLFVFVEIENKCLGLGVVKILLVVIRDEEFKHIFFYHILSASTQALLPQGPVSFPSPDEPVVRWPPTGAKLGLALPPLPQDKPLKRLLLVLEVVEAPSLLLLRSSSSSILKRPCSSSILSRLILLLLTARSIPRRPLELLMLDPEVTRLIPGWTGLLVMLVSSRDDSRVRCSCWLIMLIEA
jgi:hypothetical protein